MLIAPAFADAPPLELRFNGMITSIDDPTGYLAGITSVGTPITMTYVVTSDLALNPDIDTPQTYEATIYPAVTASQLTSGNLTAVAELRTGNLFDTDQTSITDKINLDGENFSGNHDYVADWIMSFEGPSDTFDRTTLESNWVSYLSAKWFNNITLTVTLARKIYSSDGYWSAGSDNLIASITAQLNSIEMTGGTIAGDGAVITAQPGPASVIGSIAGGAATMRVMATTGIPYTYAWSHNGLVLPDATGPTLSLPAVAPADAGLYTASISDGTTVTTTVPAILGVSITELVTGTGSIVGTDLVHPNGNHFDQVLVTGAAEAITADVADGRITRTSFIDLNDDIVQVEFAGHGTLSLVLDDASGPALPTKYTQNVAYARGHAGIVITGADETTNLSVFTVGRATAFDPTGHYNILLAPGATNNPSTNGSPLFAGHEATSYTGIADLSFVAISSVDGKFGGLRTADAHFYASNGLTGLYAPGVVFNGPVFIGDITAYDAAQPVIVLGAVSDARITGGNLAQANGAAVAVDGVTRLVFTAGSDSAGNILPAQDNAAVLEQNGTDVTADIVVNP